MLKVEKILLHKVKNEFDHVFDDNVLTLKFLAVYDALALARRPTDSVHKEYKVDSVARASNTKGLAIDVVYIQSTTSMKQPQQVILSAVHEYEILSPTLQTVLLSLLQEYTSASVGVGKNRGWEED